MKCRGVFCDTSFFIRLLDKQDPLHLNAKGYFKYLTKNDFGLLISTIAIAEYCVGGDVHDLPMRNLQVVPYNLDHALRTSEFARLIFKNRGLLQIKERRIIPNDTKLFAQADLNSTVDYFLSSDTESKKIYSLLQRELNPHFQFLDLAIPYNEAFGILDL
ncbi:hypothetical protein [Dyadobacter crusticola]|uniref:hypothetical protein n=1 Tax=Dyadobacter crusticola TaxID=292407 RepID=UPI0004E10BD1|nr:hypothetical protein [Dyadobacter crusticola]